jgi:hypothetical protein
MDTNDRDEPREDADLANQGDDRLAADPASTTIIGTNIAGANTAPFPGGIAAPAAELASEEAADDDVGPMDLDALEQFGSNRRETGDQGVSAKQRELEAGELNG